MITRSIASETSCITGGNHRSLNNVTPADAYVGRAPTIIDPTDEGSTPLIYSANSAKCSDDGQLSSFLVFADLANPDLDQKDNFYFVTARFMPLQSRNIREARIGGPAMRPALSYLLTIA